MSFHPTPPPPPPYLNFISSFFLVETIIGRIGLDYVNSWTHLVEQNSLPWEATPQVQVILKNH